MLCKPYVIQMYELTKDSKRNVRFNYRFMGEEEKGFYRSLYKAVEDMADFVDFFNITSEKSHMIFGTLDKMLKDNPSLFWVDEGGSLSYIYSDKIRFTFKYKYTREEKDRLKQLVDVATDKIYNMVKSKCSAEYDVELYVHDLLANNVVYDTDNKECYNIIGPLVFKKACCDGISRATTYLLNTFGIRSTYINGKTTESETGHAWNIVIIDNESYHLDVTWDLKSSLGRISHKYFNLSDSDIAVNHKWSKKIICNNNRYNYFIHDNKVFNTRFRLKRFLKKEFKRTKCVEFRYDGDITNDEIHRIVSEVTNCRYTLYSDGDTDVYALVRI